MTDHQVSPKTVCVVGAAHVLFLLLIVLLARHQPKPPPLTMLDLSLGLPENLNPADGQSSAQPRAPATPAPQPPATPPPAAPAPPVTPPPAPTPPPLPVTPPEPPPPAPVKPSFPIEPAPPKPAPPKPRVPVKPVLDTPVTRNTVPANRATAGNSGVNPTAVANSLRRSMGGDPTAGIPGGAGNQSSPGSPAGNPNGDWYRTLIKNTLERHWMKPQSGNPNLAATVKIRVLADGTIQSLGMVSGSGNAEMDASVLAAIRAAGKISSPPPTGFKIPYEDTVIFRLRSDL